MASSSKNEFEKRYKSITEKSSRFLLRLGFFVSKAHTSNEKTHIRGEKIKSNTLEKKKNILPSLNYKQLICSEFFKVFSAKIKDNE